MYNSEIKNFHVVNPRTSILTTNANHLGDMDRWGGTGLILLEDKTKQKKLKTNRTTVVDDYKTTII
jgi:hypothetical protein